MSDTEDEYEQMLVKALQLALEEDQEERDQKHQQIESRKKLVPKTRRSMPGESGMQIPEQQEISESNDNQAKEHSKDAKERTETPNAGNVSGELGAKKDASDKNHNHNDETHNDEAHDDEDMTENDENEDHSSSPSPTRAATTTAPPSIPFTFYLKPAPSPTPDNEPTKSPIFITPFAVPAGNRQNPNLLWTTKTEMTDVPGGVLPEQKGQNTNIPVFAKEKEEEAHPKPEQASNPEDRSPLTEEQLWGEIDDAQ